MQVDHMT